MSNYPDGMRESDIPGWWDVECPLCAELEDFDEDCKFCSGSGMADSRDVERWHYEQTL